MTSLGAFQIFLLHIHFLSELELKDVLGNMFNHFFFLFDSFSMYLHSFENTFR